MLRIDTLTIKKSRKAHRLDTQAAHQSYKSAFQAMTESLRREVAEKQGELRV